MKKKLIKRNILVWAGALLAIVAFFVAFSAGLKTSSIEIKGLIIGTVSGSASVGTITTDEGFHATLSLIGIIVGLVAAAGAVVTTLLVKDKKVSKLLIVVCGLLMVVACVFVFLLKQSYISTGAAKLGFPRDVVAEAYKSMNINAGCVISAILFGLGGVTTVASEFVK